MSNAAVSASPTSSGSWSDEGRALVRGAAGGALFGIPLLYTMEVWWIGSYTSPGYSALVLALTLVVVALLIHTAGFRRHRDVHWLDVALDAVKAVSLGILSALVVLALIGEVWFDVPLEEVIGKVVYESAPFAIGVAVASHVMSSAGRSGDDDDGADGAEPHRHDPFHGTVADLGATVIGAVFVGFNIAPTDEVQMIAAASTPVSLLCLMIVTLLATYGIVFMAGFGDQHARRTHEGIFQHPVTETAVAYLVAFVTSAGMLFFFRNLSADDPWPIILQSSVILGLPAAIGGAAGRLAI